MATLQEIRQQMPQYDGLSDQDLADRIYAKFYQGQIDRDQFDVRVGLKEAGLANNITAGVNEAVYGGLGLPIDATRGLYNTLTQPEAEPRPGIPTPLSVMQSIGGALGLPAMPDDTVGSGKWWAERFGDVGVNKPDEVVPLNDWDRIGRMTGQGAASVLFPEMAMAKVLPSIGRTAPQAAETLGQVLGTGQTVRGMTTNALAGAGAGGGVGVGEAVAPDSLKPLAAAAGGLIGGGAGALTAAGVPQLAIGAGRLGKQMAAPLTTRGRERMAGQILNDSATSPGAVMAAIADAPAPLLPGSTPTTFQTTGDMGFGNLERGMSRRPAGAEAFADRRADQNAARLKALETVQTGGAPEAVVSAARIYLKSVDDQATAAVAAATRSASGLADTIGAGRPPESVGDDIRAALEAARSEAKQAERRLWTAVDPDNSLALSLGGTKRQVQGIARELTPLSQPPSAVEAQIYDDLMGLRGDVVPFRSVTDLQSRLKAAMREERFTKGESPTWRRLSMLNTAVERDLEEALATQAMRAAPVGAPTGGPAANAPRVGSAVYTPSGERVGVQYEVVDAARLIASQLDDLRTNPKFDESLQPRDRSRAASDVQIARIAGELQPERLGASASAAEGAPIIGPDDMVESGNARVLGLRRAYQQNGPQAQAYRQYLIDQGYDVSGLARPVLVRRRVDDLGPADRRKFVQDANASTTLTMSAAERARTDASRLDENLLGLYRGGDIEDAANRDFVRGFLRSVGNSTDQGALTTGDGRLSTEGAQRVRGALLQSAYEDAPLIEALLETGDENIRAFGRALTDLAGDVAKLKAGIRAGSIDTGADLSKPMVEAAKVVQDARKRGVAIADAVGQQDAFSRLSEGAEEVLRLAYGDDMRGRISRERFSTAMQPAIAEASAQTTDARLFGEAMNSTDILSGAVARYGTSNQTANQPNSFANPRQGAGAPGDRGRRPGTGAPGARSPEARGPGGSRVLDEPALQPNFTPEALGRLRTARGATRDRAGTFDNRTLRPILQRPASNAPYASASSGVPQKLFFSGPRSFDAINTYRAAVGDDVALPLIRDYAANRLARSALRDDGTIDPGKLATWRRTHSDALRALPDLDRQLVDTESAGRAIGEAVAARKVALDQAQAGSLGKLMGLEDPADIVRTVGGIFGRKDAVNEFARLRGAVGNDPQALEGLRKSIVEHVTQRFISNTEAGTSGLNQIKSDAFQRFVRDNETALRVAGLPTRLQKAARWWRKAVCRSRLAASLRLRRCSIPDARHLSPLTRLSGHSHHTKSLPLSMAPVLPRLPQRGLLVRLRSFPISPRLPVPMRLARR